MPKIKYFTDLLAWKMAHILVLEIYKITLNFPKTETYLLVNQLRRCAVSITSNIAEGFARKTVKDKQYFYYVSKGSVSELHSQLLVARDLGFINDVKFDEVQSLLKKVTQLLHGLIRSAIKLRI